MKINVAVKWGGLWYRGIGLPHLMYVTRVSMYEQNETCCQDAVYGIPQWRVIAIYSQSNMTVPKPGILRAVGTPFLNPSVRLYALNYSRAAERIFIKFCVGSFAKNLSINFCFCLDLVIYFADFAWRLRAFVSASWAKLANILSEKRMFRTKVAEHK
jgi:hypothetical protein